MFIIHHKSRIKSSLQPHITARDICDISITTLNFHYYFTLISGIILLGLSPILISVADAPGMITAFYRMFIPTLLLVIPFFKGLKQYKEKIKRVPEIFIFAMTAGIFFGIDMALWSTGVKNGGGFLLIVNGGRI